MQQALIFIVLAQSSMFVVTIRLTQRSGDAGCKMSESYGCQSPLEIKQDGKCVMAHNKPQYAIGSSALDTAANFESMMLKYYQGNRSALEGMMELSDEGHRVLVEKIGRSLLYTKKFVVGAIGSSVTAGHDNCDVDSYSAQLYHLLAPIFRQAGVDFQTRNGGIGGACGDFYVDQVYCMEYILGPDVDVTSFSWDYFPYDEDNSFHEDFVRLSLSMQNHPMPLILTLNNVFTKSHKTLYDAYGRFGYHGMAATRTNPPGVPPKVGKIWGFVGDGIHRWTRLADAFPEDSCRRKSTGILWRNWHGGPMLYQRISDALGWTYVKALKVALQEIHDGASFTKNPQQLTLQESSRSKLSSVPRCLSFNSPSFSKPEDRPIRIIKEKSSEGTVSIDDHRIQMIPAEEKNEPLCGHRDKCGNMKSDRLTFNLQAKDNSPLKEGVLVICIGGGPPPHVSKFEKVFNTEKLQMEGPATAIFPHCALGAVASVTVDGESYNLSKATPWKNKSEILVKCGSFSLHRKDAREVTVEGPCGVTHLFAF